MNANGKVDLFQLNRGMVSGDKYTVEPIRENDQLSGFELIPARKSLRILSSKLSMRYLTA